jgi:quinol monooxygenase YgiN
VAEIPLHPLARQEVRPMSVLIVGKVNGDTDRFRRAVVDRGDEFAKIAEEAKSAGALHHRFGVGNGYVLIVDEWGSAEQFQQFFSNPQLQAFVASVGGDTTSPPDLTITEAIDSSDQF